MLELIQLSDYVLLHLMEKVGGGGGKICSRFSRTNNCFISNCLIGKGYKSTQECVVVYFFLRKLSEIDGFNFCVASLEWRFVILFRNESRGNFSID